MVPAATTAAREARVAARRPGLGRMEMMRRAANLVKSVKTPRKTKKLDIGTCFSEESGMPMPSWRRRSRFHDVVVVEVVCIRNAAPAAKEVNDQFGEPIELVDTGGLTKGHAGEDEEAGLARGRVHESGHHELRGANRTPAVGHLDVVGPARHRPAADASDEVVEHGGDPSREIGGIARDGLAEGGALVVQAVGSVVAATTLD
eukprot:scaffold49646_cov48-Phaeocystis_antarctica.AAC.1